MSETNEGFFKKFHETISESLDDVVTNNFMNLESNAKRVSYLSSLPVIKNYDLTKDLENCTNGSVFPVCKNLDRARNLKAEGNHAVQKGDWTKAFQLYSQSLFYMPQNETEELSIVLANRSAALNHLEQHEDAMTDIRRCLDSGYPRNLQYKVLERRARCLLVLKRNKEAIFAFQETVKALDDAKLDIVKKQKMQKDAQIMIQMLQKGLSFAENSNDPQPVRLMPPKPKLLGNANPQYPAASEAIKIDYDVARGRFATATRNIDAGEILLIEKPYSGVLLAEYAKTHCQNCFVKCSIPLPCPKCPNVIFCSDKCLDVALKTYHSFECSILPIIWKSGCSITCHIALRIITQNNMDYYANLAKDLDNEPEGVYKTNDYRNLFYLVAHEEKRPKNDLLHRTQMAVFLTKLLELSGYFEGKPKDIKLDDIKTMSIENVQTEHLELIGGLILKNLQILQFNAHEVSELQCPTPRPSKNIVKHDGKSVFLAGAVYPTLALFNHSCDPGIVRYFCKSTVVIRAVKNINKGEEVAENYGPIFTTVSKEKRLAQLREQYWFDCTCRPCEENWPLYNDMNENYMRFKCDSDRPCQNVVPVPHDAKEFMIKCGLCDQYTNILKGLKALQDTDMMIRLAQHSMLEGKYGEALKKFVEILKLYDGTLATPYRSYYDCIQDIRRCMLSMGNYSLV